MKKKMLCPKCGRKMFDADSPDFSKICKEMYYCTYCRILCLLFSADMIETEPFNPSIRGSVFKNESKTKMQKV